MALYHLSIPLPGALAPTGQARPGTLTAAVRGLYSDQVTRRLRQPSGAMFAVHRRWPLAAAMTEGILTKGKA